LFFRVCGSSLEIEIYPTQPPTPPCIPDIVRKDEEWNKDGLKWQCKMDNYTIAYVAKWLFTKHLKEVHGLMAKKAKLERPSTSKRNPQHQDHVKMNICILGNVMVM
jgi:hypothetical protein